MVYAQNLHLMAHTERSKLQDLMEPTSCGAWWKALLSEQRGWVGDFCSAHPILSKTVGTEWLPPLPFFLHGVCHACSFVLSSMGHGVTEVGTQRVSLNGFFPVTPSETPVL